MCRVEGSLEARQALVLREQIVPMAGINEGRMAPVIAKSPPPMSNGDIPQGMLLID